MSLAAKVYEVPWNTHPTFMGEHMPLHACACLDHAYRVRLIYPRCSLVGLGVHYLSVINPTLLYLLIESGAMKTHIGARWPFDGAVVEVVPGDGATSPSHAMTQPVGNGALLRVVSPHRTVFTLTQTSVHGLGPQLGQAIRAGCGW